MILPKGEGVAVTCCLDIHGLRHIGLHVDEHLSLSLCLLSLGSRFLFLHGPRGLIHFLFFLDKVVLIFIIDIDLGGSIVLPDVMKLKLAADHLRNHVPQLIRVIQDICLAGALRGRHGLPDMWLRVIGIQDNRDDKWGWLRGRGRLHDYLWLLDNRWLRIEMLGGWHRLGLRWYVDLLL